MFEDDLKGELFNKIGTESTGNPEMLLDKAESELKADNGIEAKKLFKELINITGANAIRYEGQSQHRAAANEFYLQAVAYEYMEQTDERDANYSKVIDSLLSASKTAIQFSEMDKGLTSATIAGLVCVVSGNNNRAFDIYTQHMGIAEGKQNETALKQILYSLGYLLDALKNTNVAALSDAENYISKDLTPMLQTSKLTGFRKLMGSVVEYAQQVMQSRIKMPKIQIESQIPKDLLFNDNFEIKLTILNSGEGEAFNLAFNVEIPVDFEILNGTKSVDYEKIDASGNEQIGFTLRYQTAMELSEKTEEIKGTLSYTDMLGNTHKQYFGPLPIELRAVSKSSEYQVRLDGLKTSFTEIAPREINPIIQMLVPPLTSLFNQGVTQVENLIENKEYSNADAAIEYLESVVTWQKNFLGGDEVATQIINSINSRIKEAEVRVSTELGSKFKTEKDEALDELRSTLQLLHDQEITKASDEMKSSHSQEMNLLKEENFKEVGKLNQAHENKLNKHMAEQSQKLETKFIQDMNEQSDKFENTLRELQSQHEEEIDNERNQIKEDSKIKHNHEISILKETKEEEIRKLKEAHEENVESTVQTQRTKLKKEKTDEIEQVEIELRRDLTSEHEKSLDEMKKKLTKDIETKDAQLLDLERQIRDLKASSG